jgi:hypothetical protein
MSIWAGLSWLDTDFVLRTKASKRPRGLELGANMELDRVKFLNGWRTAIIVANYWVRALGLGLFAGGILPVILHLVPALSI